MAEREGLGVVHSERQGSGPALRCEEVVKRYGEVTAVDGLDLSVDYGECFGLLGPNGAGKTTTVEILAGLTEPDEGRVEVLGRRWGTGGDRDLRELLGIQLQETRLPNKLTVEETLRLFRSFVSRGQSTEELLGLVELEEKRRSRVEGLSGGQRKRLALACALVGRPRLVFLDEPTSGLDPQSRLKIWEVVELFLRDGGTVMLTTHAMEEAARLCDRVAILDHGRVLASDTPAALVASLDTEQVLRFEALGELSEGALRKLPAVSSLRRKGATCVLSISDIGIALPALMAELRRQELPLRTLTTHQATLEDVFVSLTGRALRDT